MPHESCWLNIESIPKDEDRVVLTDQGTARWLGKNAAAYWCVKAGFFCCDMSGNIFECADNGISGSRIEPRYWMEIPPLPNH